MLSAGDIKVVAGKWVVDVRGEGPTEKTALAFAELEAKAAMVGEKGCPGGAGGVGSSFRLVRKERCVADNPRDFCVYAVFEAKPKDIYCCIKLPPSKPSKGKK